MEEFLKAAKNGEAYGYIANHYHEMSRFDLRTILLEYIYFCEDEETVILWKIIGEVKNEKIHGSM